MARKQVKKGEELFVCACCFSDDVLFEEMVSCNEGHLFCKKCVKRYVEILIGNGKCEFPCLLLCGAVFHTNTLKVIFPYKIYEKLLKKIQEMEVKSANIPGIEFCPYCEYAEILADNITVFTCQICKKQYCRLCKKVSHFPVKCMIDRKETAARKYIEDKMADAIIRTCYRCHAKFIKQDGCNKMTCVCGAVMCYICRKPVTKYDHFHNGQPESNKCPLYSTNEELHVRAVKDAGEKALSLVKDDISYDCNPFKGLPGSSNTQRR